MEREFSTSVNEKLDEVLLTLNKLESEIKKLENSSSDKIKNMKVVQILNH